ncbi:MAG: Kef family K(+) transporter [Methylobacterium sp.]|uniref:YbaL family putative K(+) efflux transporter n=1 Tax=Methylobacterium sp. TaxID=409 RepID=UPI0025E66CA3|nr:YbaL family putative K(+) efflux transporter [Methylobacterium sp.]MBX9934842.1 Kef family K(+) transporter [Methylobacterium sp.]
MPHHTSLIATIVAGLGLAFIFGALAHRLKLSPLVGYLVAGVLIGPFTPGYVADQQLAPQLAEIGVILLMFGVGLHFSLKDLLAVKAIALPGAIGQMAIATGLGMSLAWSLGWSLGAGLVFGLALSVASTVVLLRSLQERRLIESEKGRIAVGWLIVEDLAMVLALVLLPALSGLLGGRTDAAARNDTAAAVQAFGLVDWLDPGSVWLALALTLIKVAAFVGLMLLVGRRVIPWVLHWVAHTGSRELFRLAVLAIALGVAFGSAELFGVSFALGAFFAGMILAESQLSHQAAQETLPLRDAFAVLFFVSVGMLFDPAILVRQPGPVLATVGIIVVGKSIAALLIVLVFRHPLGTALTISASLAQIGEFSFILAGLGVSLALLPPEGQDLILAGALLSILINPLLFVILDRFAPRLQAREQQRQRDHETDERAATASTPELHATALNGHTVLVGYGRVGSLIGEALKERGEPFLVIEERAGTVEPLRAQGVEVILGNAGHRALLEAANLAGAKCLVSAIPNPFEASTLLERARAANPAIEIVARAHSDAEVEHLQRFGADRIVLGELEIAREMASFLFRERGTFAAFDTGDLTAAGDAFERAQIGPGARARQEEEISEEGEGVRMPSLADADVSRRGAQAPGSDTSPIP